MGIRIEIPMGLLWIVVALGGCPSGDGGAVSEDDDTVADDDSAVDDDDAGDDDALAGTDEDGDGWTVEDGDCDDLDADIHPAAAETCDGLDNDCNGAVDDVDGDHDGHVDVACGGDDCDDSEQAVNPSAPEICDDGLDNDCDGTGNGCGLSGLIALANADATLFGEEAVDHAGMGVSSAGDVNGDGLDDVLVGATMGEAGGGSAGAAYVLHGPFSGVFSLAVADAKLVGEQSGEYLGASVSSAGDVNGDGFADLLIGARGHHAGGTSAGAAYVVSGPVTGTLDLAMADAKLVGPDAYEYAGWSVSAAGDVDGDGFDDLLVGAPGPNGEEASEGAAYLVLGPVTGSIDLALADAELVAEAATDRVGYSVSGVGDQNADTFDDLLVGAPVHDGGGEDAGAAYLVRGPVSGTVDLAHADAKLVGAAPGAQAGSAVASAGDVNGDGLPDLFVGAPYDSTAAYCAGAAYLVHGPANGTLDLTAADARLYGEADNDNAGTAVSSAGDVDGDGLADLLVGAPGHETDGYEGAIYLVYGPVSGAMNLAQADAKFVDTLCDSHAGTAISAAGDINGDGHGDLLLGADDDDTVGADAGVAYLFYGASRL